MNMIALALSLAVAASAGTAIAQGPGNQEIYSPGYTPPVQRKATPQEKSEGKASRRQAGAGAAREDTHAEGKPIPEPKARVAPEERRAARATRKAETRRANKAGEITSRGESSGSAK